MSKLMVLAAAAGGYVMGARAGRERYEQIRVQAQKVWTDPRVQQKRAEAQDLAREKAQQAADAATEKASAAADKATNGLDRG